MFYFLRAIRVYFYRLIEDVSNRFLWWHRIVWLLSDEFYEENCVRGNQIAYLKQEVRKLKEKNDV